MQEFQGWTPAVIDNLTINQLNIIFVELDKYRKLIPPVDVTLEIIRQAIFSYLGVKKSKSIDDGGDIKFDGIPVTKGKKEELEAWYKTKMQKPFSTFVKQYRKEHK